MKIEFDFGTTFDSVALNRMFEEGLMFGNEVFFSNIENTYEANEPVVNEIAAMSGYAAGILDLVAYYLVTIQENPQITFYQLNVVREFESDVANDWVAEWGLTPDIVRPPKGTGWEQYQGLAGYRLFADTFAGGDMLKGYMLTSAICKFTGRELASLAWPPQFAGSVHPRFLRSTNPIWP